MSRPWRNHCQSRRSIVLNFHIVAASSAKPIAISTPRNGCRIRVQGPPPSKPLNQYSDGWNNASPERAATMNRMATIQWLVRSLGV